jgi:predicted adenine nucleotide alpha hydrolase (AANH) superfamily ATPase
LKILIHICCAPCAVYPLKILRIDDTKLYGFFYNNNIHPYLEWKKRAESLKDYANTIHLNMIWQKNYDMEDFIRNVAFRESERCVYCYHDRMKVTALTAKRGHFDFFTTTLLYSKFQKHELIASIGESVGKITGVPFLYKDFRKGWKEGIEESKHMQLYRQAYCGCIYSEKERFYKNTR